MSSIIESFLQPIKLGWIDDQTYYATRPVQPGVSLAMSAQELNEKILQDPEFLVRYLRAQGGL